MELFEGGWTLRCEDNPKEHMSGQDEVRLNKEFIAIIGLKHLDAQNFGVRRIHLSVLEKSGGSHVQ